jgi:hypothetical protein
MTVRSAQLCFRTVVQRRGPFVARGCALALSSTLALGCGNSSSTTTGKRVTFTTRVDVDADTGTEFTTAFGWHVKLDRAAVAVGSLYYFDGEPAFVRREAPQGPLERFASLFEGVAHAHPGHYQAGDALGQMLEPGSVDLFAVPASLGTGDGVTGTYWSGRFTFAKKVVGKAANELDGNVAFAEGTAVKVGDAGPDGATEIHFRVSATFDELAKSGTMGEVDGCEFKKTDIEGDGTVTLTLKPSIFFDYVDFGKIDAGSADKPTEIPAGDVAHIGFERGLAQLTAYDFSFSK